ncbi:hypothetical protein DNU06_11190 [Putridiphycobacter roseus]|uniref:SPOR domain-containing protein n=1 Tax=Putridiphycobacter roseus TaxID=2219161 RepID=A0A2W1MZJ7_9FLAO|nr:SPOR domain-containing protein [Putridiphycobacter roseus]PZE16814.1 hypothetical protein DNU06_11190 [Putridiphycobacter roseus]
MNKYIIELLKHQSSLILPGIGALMVINKRTGEIKFNPHLTFNDGALADYIAQEDNIDKTEAQNKVAKFTRDIKAKLDKGESYDIFEFGNIFKNANGEISFEMAATKETPETNKSEKIAKVMDEVKETTEKLVQKSTDKTKEIVKSVDKVTEETKEVAAKIGKDLKAAKNTFVAKEEIKDKNIVPKIVQPSKSKIDNKIPIAEASVKIKETVENTLETEKKKRKLWPILLLLLIGLGVAGYFYQNKIKSFLGLDKQNTLNNVNNYPDADQDGIPDFADIDITKGTDADGDGIDDLADLDYSKGKDADGDGIDDAFAALAMAPIQKEFDPLEMLDEDEDGIPDFADVDITMGTDENHNGIDDNFDAAIIKGTDIDKDCIVDSLKNIALLNQINANFKDSDNNGIPDFADVNETGGPDVNENGIDDMYESVDRDINNDGIHDSIQMAMVATDHISPAEEPVLENNTATDQLEESVGLKDEIIADEQAMEEIEKEVVKVEAVKKPKTTSTGYTAKGNYHAIGGAFEEKSNAENYTETMKNKGYTALIVGRFDGLYLVSIKQYNSLNEATTNLSDIRSAASSAWIFKH